MYNVFQFDSLSYLLESFQPIAIASEFWVVAMSLRAELVGWRWARLLCDWSRSIGIHYYDLVWGYHILGVMLLCITTGVSVFLTP